MYEQHFGFSRTPFRLESEPDMFFFGKSQHNVLECIKHSLSERKAIITLSGLPGSGKTTVMRKAIEVSIVPDTIICRINRARCSDFLNTLKNEIISRIPINTDLLKKDLNLEKLVNHALQEKKHFLIVVDESQQLTEHEVDQLFLLVDIEKANRKHFKFLLVSHEPFDEYFDLTKYSNSETLLSTHCFLSPLLKSELLPYIEHRLSNTGWDGSPSFDSNIENLIYSITQGIPRSINSFFDRLMLFCYFESQQTIDVAFVELFCRDLLTELETQTHPDLDSFDLRQSLRREMPLFELKTTTEEIDALDNAATHETEILNASLESENEDENSVAKNAASSSSADESPVQSNETETEIDETWPEDTSAITPIKKLAPISTKTGQSEEPLASENPQELIAFVVSFVRNPERYKNYTDQYYKLPKNLTLLLCLATETDNYIEKSTPADLSDLSASEIKTMIALFIQKMLITSRLITHRILGLDESANEDEINRHFTYMMRLCRSEYIQGDVQEFECIIKDAYIKLLSGENPSETDSKTLAALNAFSEKNSQDSAYELNTPSIGTLAIDDIELSKHRIVVTENNKEDIQSEQEKISVGDVDPVDVVISSSGGKLQVVEKSKIPLVPIGLTLAASAAVAFFAIGFNGSSEDQLNTNSSDTFNQQAHNKISSPTNNNLAAINSSQVKEIKILPKNTLNAKHDDTISLKNNSVKEVDKLLKKHQLAIQNSDATTLAASQKASVIPKVAMLDKTIQIKTENQKPLSTIALTKPKPAATNKSPTKAANITNLSIAKLDTHSNNLLAEENRDSALNVKRQINQKNSETFVNANVTSSSSILRDDTSSDNSNTFIIPEPTIANANNTARNNSSTAFPGESDLPFTADVAESSPNPLMRVSNRIDNSDSVLLDNTPITATAPLSAITRNKGEDVKSTTFDTLNLGQESIADEKAFFKKRDLERLVGNFSFAYEEGDIDEFSALFTTNALTNNGFNREQIIEDYEELFEETDNRSIEFKDLLWSTQDDTSVATGKFSIEIQRSEQNPPKTVEGNITLKVVNTNDAHKISEMFFLYQVAGAE